MGMSWAASLNPTPGLLSFEILNSHPHPLFPGSLFCARKARVSMGKYGL